MSRMALTYPGRFLIIRQKALDQGLPQFVEMRNSKTQKAKSRINEIFFNSPSLK